MKLVLEADGPSHDDPEQRDFDEQRTKYLQKSGWRVMRVSNDDIYSALGDVEARIIAAIGE